MGQIEQVNRVVLFRDARDYQILFLSLFLVMGIGTQDWTLRPEMIEVAIATSLLIQTLAAYLTFLYQQKIQNTFQTFNPSLRIALITTLEFFVSTGIFWVLFCLAPSTVLFDRIWGAPRFIRETVAVAFKSSTPCPEMIPNPQSNLSIAKTTNH